MFDSKLNLSGDFSDEELLQFSVDGYKVKSPRLVAWKPLSFDPATAV